MAQHSYGGTLARQIRLQRRSRNITTADLTAAALTQAIAIGNALPATAVLVAHGIYLTTVFASPGAGSLDVQVGDSVNDDDSIVAAYDAYTGSANLGLWSNGDTVGINPTGTPSGTILQALLTATVDNLNAFTTGNMQIDVWFLNAINPE